MRVESDTVSYRWKRKPIGWMLLISVYFVLLTLLEHFEIGPFDKIEFGVFISWLFFVYFLYKIVALGYKYFDSAAGVFLDQTGITIRGWYAEYIEWSKIEAISCATRKYNKSPNGLRIASIYLHTGSRRSSISISALPKAGKFDGFGGKTKLSVLIIDADPDHLFETLTRFRDKFHNGVRSEAQLDNAQENPS
ncbi:MAG TPA: hypothetical protein VEH84_02980 [Alphaproteobacteria bacterium]|nr:hypothetical protein [Alphaproteobacteria bacterium]